MSANTLDNRKGLDSLATKINDLERQLREMRTLQQSSAYALQIIGYPTNGVVGIYATIPANTTEYFSFALQPVDLTLTIWNFYLSIYVGWPTIPTDAGHKLPYGNLLTSNQKLLRFTTWGDWGDSSDLNGTRVHMVEVVNPTANSHNILMAGKFYGPKAELVT